MEALHDVLRAGKVRYLGASSMYAWQFAKAQYTADLGGWTRFVSMQDHYNLLYREEEREMLPFCADQGVGVLPWSPLARGRLTRDWDAGTARAETDEFGAGLYRDEDRSIVDAVAVVAQRRGVPRAHVALAWLLHQPVVTSPIFGATKAHHVTDALAAVDLELTVEELEELSSGYVPHPVSGHRGRRGTSSPSRRCTPPADNGSAVSGAVQGRGVPRSVPEEAGKCVLVVLAAEDRPHDLGQHFVGLRQSLADIGTNDPLGRVVGTGRPGGQLPGQLQRALRRLGVVEHPVHDVPPLQGLGVEELAGHHQLTRPTRASALGDAGGTTHRRAQRHHVLRQPELRRAGRHDDVAGQGDLEGRGQGERMRREHHRARQRLDALPDLQRVAPEGNCVLGIHVGEELHVDTSRAHPDRTSKRPNSRH